MKKFKKKSQSEIMGLAIIVILIVIGFTFMLKFMAQSKPKDYKLSYSTSQMTSNFIQTLLKTTSKQTNNCEGMDYAELITTFDGDSGFECDATPTNEVIEDEITAILENTVGANLLKHTYYFSIDWSGTDMGIGTECEGSKASSPFTLPSSTGTTIEIKLDICKD
jgi:hypothetical protein